jgi:hypothetical protein
MACALRRAILVIVCGRTAAGVLWVALFLAACGGSARSHKSLPMPSGSPAPGSDEGIPPVSKAELGRPLPLGGTDPCFPEPLTLADTLSAALADLRAQPAQARPFLRYVSVGQFRPGSCSARDESYAPRSEVDRGRMAVSKLVNGLSREPRAVVPAAVGPDGLLLRLDLRDYGWRSPVTVEGRRYEDVWEAVVGRAALALELEGGAASELTRELGTSVPILLASSFVATAVQAELYYGALALPDTLADLERGLGIAAEEGLERGPWARASFSNSGVSKEPRGVARYRGAALGDGFFWQTFEHAPSARSESQYLEPLSEEADGHMVLFSLPNGLPAYFATDGSGQRLTEPGFVLDPAQNNGRMQVASSCCSCHNAGTITFTDAVRPFAEDNPDLFSPAELARVRETFPLPSEMQALVDADGGRIMAALERAGQPKGTPDPLSRAVLDYEQGLSFDRLAAELFLDRPSLIQRLASLPEDMAVAAAAGTLERSVFEARYREVACALYATADSHPVGCR